MTIVLALIWALVVACLVLLSGVPLAMAIYAVVREWRARRWEK